MPYRPPRGVRPPQLEGKRTGRPKKVKEAPLSQESEGLLAAMRHVLATPQDRTYEQRAVREWLEEDQKGFLRYLAKLEAADSTRRGPLTLDVVNALSNRLEAVMVRCLEKHAAKRGDSGEALAGPQERGDSPRGSFGADGAPKAAVSSALQERDDGPRGSFEGEDFLEDFLEPRGGRGGHGP
jgi:hypothetical protein